LPSGAADQISPHAIPLSGAKRCSAAFSADSSGGAAKRAATANAPRIVPTRKLCRHTARIMSLKISDITMRVMEVGSFSRVRYSAEARTSAERVT
jgi:hypothetical protein